MVDSALARLIEAVTDQFSGTQIERIAEGDLVPGLVEATPTEPGTPMAPLPEEPVCVLGISPVGVELAFVALSDPAASIFLDWTEESSARKALERLEGFDLRVIDRRPENPAEQYSARKAKWVKAGRLSMRLIVALDEFDENARDRLAADLAKADPRWERFGFAIARIWHVSPTDDPENLPGEIAAQLRLLLPIRGQIVSRTRQAKSTKPPAMERAPWREPG